MLNIKVKIIQKPKVDLVAISSLAARMTQKKITKFEEFEDLINQCFENYDTSKKITQNLVNWNHGQPLRHSHFTFLIFGTSMINLAQIRTHHAGVDWTVSSQHYNDWTGVSNYVIPFEVYELCYNRNTRAFLDYYKEKMNKVEEVRDTLSSAFKPYLEKYNLVSRFAAYQGQRYNILCTANTQAIFEMIRQRTCGRNMIEAIYVFELMKEELCKVDGGKYKFLFEQAGPGCLRFGRCTEGKMTCKENWQSNNNPILKRFEILRSEKLHEILEQGNK